MRSSAIQFECRDALSYLVHHGLVGRAGALPGPFEMVCFINDQQVAQQKIKTIISIAKHQNDIRQSAKGSCKAK